MLIRSFALAAALLGAHFGSACGFGGGIPDCEAGQEDCACTAARQCRGALTCDPTNRCVDTGGGDGDGDRSGDGDGDRNGDQVQPQPSTGGTVATGGIGGSAGGTAGSAPRPGDGDGDGDWPGADPAARFACDYLLGCEAIRGKPPTLAQCELRISTSCISCTLGQPGDCGSLEVCLTRCLQLVQAPGTVDECLDIVLPGSLPDSGECLCGRCLDPFASCVGDPVGLCYPIAECCGRTGQSGQGCYTVPECMRVIDEAGVTSASVALATEVGNCQNSNGCQ